MCMPNFLAMLVIMQDLTTNGQWHCNLWLKVQNFEREREIIQREVSVLIDAMPQFQDAGETLMDTQGGSSNECLGNSQCCMIST